MGDYGEYSEQYEGSEMMREQNLAELELSSKLPIKNHLDRLDVKCCCSNVASRMTDFSSEFIGESAFRP